MKDIDDIIILIKTLGKTLDTNLDKLLQEYDLTSQQGRVLFYVNYQTYHLKQDVHQNDIEKKFHLSKSTVSGLIDRLVRRGMLNRVNEGSSVKLISTEEGSTAIQHFYNNHTKTVNKLTQGLTENEIQEMKERIKLLIGNLKEEETNV